ncbi:hypothetical protein TBLA_0B08460 [Henningerozyma blattae CBS 6284]|uniref:FZ domain-containing protein n=1 Tax=Henningerozyma blattae (strain ATCC 34711 / CBS 6284 / DSM 70876 / NBRC 10599 / NRRL Y-10934 / UCD 77-7) TaxID=1071380 RepID=I2GZV9_HENB6|nr:hypothetical protein TBLA_0B08460 [Tetrapisispora blattae CBS 6284]CCH59661.1 hypothetical protein TBLA_0B08460 [Tetrapisispora blattae CBS 6284]
MIIPFSCRWIHHIVPLFLLSRVITATDYQLQRWDPIRSSLKPGQSDHFTYNINVTQLGQDYFNTVEVLLFISGTIESMPLRYYNLTDNTQFQNDTALQVTYYFSPSDPSNSTKIGYNNITFENGYIMALGTSPITYNPLFALEEQETTNITGQSLVLEYTTLHLEVSLINPQTGEIIQPSDNDDYYDYEDDDDNLWTYHLGVAEDDQLFQYDERSWIHVLDTDHNSALVTSGNDSTRLTTYLKTNNTLESPYELFLYSLKDSEIIENNLNCSLSAILNGPYMATSISNDSNSTPSTNYKKISLNVHSLQIQKQLVGDDQLSNVQDMLYISGLAPNTTYALYLIRKIGTRMSNNDNSITGVVFSRQLITTKVKSTCSIIFNLDICSSVAYAAPTPLKYYVNKTAMANDYDSLVRSLYENFTTALQLIPCDAELDQRYSPLRTCEDCAQSYLNWLCSIMIPRCSSPGNFGSIFRKKFKSRNSLIDTFIQPTDNYYELMPCIDSCYEMVRDCPAQFGFSCPNIKSSDELFRHSYSYFNSSESSETCNFLGNSSHLIDRKNFLFPK